MHATSKEQGFYLAMYYLGQKASISSFLVVLTVSFKLVGSTVGGAVALLLTESSA